MAFGLMRRMTEPVVTSMRKVAVTSRGDSPLAEVYEQFGRTYWLLIYDPQTCQWEAIDNGVNRARKSGAGVATVETLLSIGVVAVLTGETGPKVFRSLAAAGVAVVHNVTGLVEDALCDWLKGRLQLAKQANDDGSPDCLLGR